MGANIVLFECSINTDIPNMPQVQIHKDVFKNFDVASQKKLTAILGTVAQKCVVAFLEGQIADMEAGGIKPEGPLVH